MNRPLVLVTGASGFLGGHIVETLLQAGYRVRCQYRRAVAPPPLVDAQPLGAELVRVDLERVTDDELARLCDGVEYIIHNAALVKDWGKMERFIAINVHAPQRLLRIAKRNAITRFIYISSIAVHGLDAADNITEDGPYSVLRNPYPISKLQGEQAILAEKDVETVVIRPGSIYGPRDTTTSYPLFGLMRARLMIYLGSKSALAPVVYCQDVADAICSALIAPAAAGRAFNITSGEQVTWERFFSVAAGYLSVPPPRVVVAKWLVFPIAWILEGIFRLLRITAYAPAITLFRVRSMVHSRYFDTSAARTALGYSPQWHIEEGLEQTVAHYRAQHTARKS